MSPARKPASSLRGASIMREVVLATTPGIIMLSVFFGWGTLGNILWAVPFALLFESLALRLRGRPIAVALRDGSALLSALLLAIALPPAAPWWLIATGIAFAILVAKHLYGGVGHNVFNPAMVGYAVLLVSFPHEMNRWLAADGTLGTGQALISPLAALRSSLGLLDAAQLDAISMATPLDMLRHEHGHMMTELAALHPQFGTLGGVGWEWGNAAFLAGGLWLLARRIIGWQAPLGMLGALLAMALLFYDGGSSSSGGSPLFHLFSGATMLGAFFIVTDPVSGARSARGRLLCGVLVGVLVYLIRHWGNYPDGLAFAVLLMNVAAPLLDRLQRRPGRRETA